MNKRKNTLAGKLEQKCEKDWSKLVLTRDLVCRACNNAPAFHPHHIVFRSQSLATKFDPDNGAGLCRTCHDRAHGTAGEQQSVAYTLVGERGYHALVDRSREIVHSPGPEWFRDKLKELKDAMGEIQRRLVTPAVSRRDRAASRISIDKPVVPQ